MTRKFLAGAAFGALAFGASGAQATPTIKHVLLISIDGMHAVDFANCANGINGGAPYCPNMAALAQTGVTYQNASTSKPSDSFPGLTAIVTGGTPKSAGMYYDVSYDRALSPPAQTTPYGIPGGSCPGQVGTQVGFDEEVDYDLTKLDGGGGINPAYLPRDPRNGCAPVYPHQFIRVNTIFEAVRGAGGYTAWVDKHPSYEWVSGPSGHGLNDFYGPEINSVPVSLPSIIGCSPLPDQTTVTSSDDYTKSFQNIKCYDSLHVQAIINQIEGRNHDGTKPAPVPTLFGMNFQAVSVGQKLVEKSIKTTGGYLDSQGTPSPALLGEIQFVDNAIGQMAAELKARGLASSTVIVISAKHGQSPIDPKSVLRIPADFPNGNSPSTFLGSSVAQAIEDDVSLIWLTSNDPSATASAVSTLEANRHLFGGDGGEIFSGNALNLLFNDPSVDSRSPNIVVAPKVGVTYTGGHGKIAEHGGFANDDTRVMLLVAGPGIRPSAVSTPVQTAQIAPSILSILGIDPMRLHAVRLEGTEVLPGL
jgi:hypothetical protein